MDVRNAGAARAKETRLADYKPSAFLIDRVQLLFQIHDDKTTVKATGEYQRNGKENDLWLDGGPYMALEGIILDGQELSENEYELSDAGLQVFDVPDEFTLQITTSLAPFENTRLEGLYASGGNLCTQCEAEGFRHITYFMDRPDVLAVYHVRIEACKSAYPILLSNGNQVSAGSINSDRHFVEWHDPFPKPCYLFALVAGQVSPFSDTFKTQSGRDVALNIYVRDHDLDKCDHAMASLKRAMRWDEDVFGLEYDLDIYNIVAVSDFNMGAMENKGLNIFNTKYVLARPETATDSDYDHIEGVIGHEYFHNWTGNRVTCRDWFQLSLKEGLTVFRDQEFSADMGSRAVKRIDDVKVLRMLQFSEDAGPLAHPVRPESYFEINNFYTTTIYNKGAEVIRMMARILGRETFVKGVQRYLQHFDGQAATCEDFVSCMEDESGQDLEQFRLWYSQAGTPTLECKRQYRNGKMSLTVRQSCPATPGQSTKKPMHIPLVVGWLDDTGNQAEVLGEGACYPVGNGICLSVTQAEQTFEFANCPPTAIPSLLRGFSAPVHLTSDLKDHERAVILKSDQDEYARWEAGQQLFSNYLLTCLSGDGFDAASQMQVMDMLLISIKSILEDTSIDPAFAAELISVPTETQLGQQQDVLDPDGIHRVRESFLEKVADECWSSLLQKMDEVQKQLSDLDIDKRPLRKLRNLLLSFLAHSQLKTSEAKSLVLDHYTSASNMTDQFAALTILCNRDWDEKEQALASFYDQWKHEDLVVDKWFAVQAQSPFVDAIHGITSLMSHKAFTLNNPNRLRSLISIFAMTNQRNFHASDGSGYNLLSDVIGKVDTINPQTAARMIAPLGRWMRVDERRQEMMKASLQSLLSLSALSDDVRELAEKSLR